MIGRTPRSLLVAGLLIFAGTAQATISASERTVLLNLYASTGGSTWTQSTNWNGAAGTECTWYGVGCDGTGTTVTSIVLSNNNLTGSLPSDLKNLTNLNSVNFNKNGLTGPIPVLTGLTALQHFEAQNNQLTGSIPSLTGLTNLIDFYVSYNQLTGPIPSLTGLTNLTSFSAGNNQLTGSIPALTGLTALQYFEASRNQLTGPIPPLTDLTQVRGFYIYNNQLTGSIPALDGLTKLAYFQVRNNQLTGNVPSVPSPSALVAGGSSLCPNFLIHTQVMAWDLATGDTPWFNVCTTAPPAPALLGAASRKVHGGAGTLNLPLAP